MRVHGRGRRQPDRLADVPDRRRIAVLRRVLLDEVEDLLLALRQVLADVHPIGLLGQMLAGCTNMCSVQYRASRTDSRPAVQPAARDVRHAAKRAPPAASYRTSPWPPKPHA